MTGDADADGSRTTATATAGPSRFERRPDGAAVLTK